MSNKKKKHNTVILKFLQHVLITVAAVMLLMYVASSIVVVSSYDKNEIYHLSTGDQGRAYEDSVFFNTVLGKETEGLLKYVTIRTQMETNGAYDPDKIIDVATYNARQENGYSDTGNVTAQYHLGDLLKWTKYGFEYKDVEVRTDTVSSNYLNKNVYDSPDGGETADLYGTDYNDTYSMLINRYNTADGHVIEELADNWNDYYILTGMIQSCSEDLYYNYTDYLKLSDYYNALNSNIRYWIIMGDGADSAVYTNTALKAADEAKVASAFKAYGRYISYDVDRMVYDTNTAINESAFNSLISRYRYAYPDDCRIYIGVDMTMPADDAVRSARSGFVSTYLPDTDITFGIIVLCIIGYLILLVICTIHEGVERNEDGTKTIRFTDFDNTPIELWLIIFAVIQVLFIGIPAAIASTYFDSFRYEAMSILKDIYVYVIFGVVVFIFDVLMLWLYYSLVRRVRGRHIWKQSFLYKVLNAIGQGAVKVYDNGNLLLRSVVPYAGLLLLNLFLIVMTAVSDDNLVQFMLIAVLIVIDALAGVFIYKQVKDRDQIMSGMKRIISGDLSYKADVNAVHGDNRELGICVNSIGESVRNAVEQSMKDERMKTELLANVSHDIRTPLTSIINYVDLIKRENIDDMKIASYVDILDEKSQRLKTLTDDLIEASKVSSGNVELELMKMNLPEMVTQALAEFDERLAEKNLSVVTNTENLTIPSMMADGKSLWRVMENLLSNVCKYAMPGTRVFVDMFNRDGGDTGMDISLRITNTSEIPLPADLTELTERFSRGDTARTTEGSGLGLSIAKSLTELMGGTFRLFSEADLFKAEITFKAVQ
ncbi:MAG: HAMP domain-containing histidine kinase [Lachnospiraceae bacterium]|nr:HAMP domain-containing histidine kinase [Lachnospiraceae bacterium]